MHVQFIIDSIREDKKLFVAQYFLGKENDLKNMMNFDSWQETSRNKMDILTSKFSHFHGNKFTNVTNA